VAYSASCKHRSLGGSTSTASAIRAREVAGEDDPARCTTRRTDGVRSSYHWMVRLLRFRAWHRAILLGFTPYLLVFSVVLELLRRGGWGVAAWAGVADSMAYLTMMSWWAFAAWSPERVPEGVSPEVLGRLGLAEGT